MDFALWFALCKIIYKEIQGQVSYPLKPCKCPPEAWQTTPSVAQKLINKKHIVVLTKYRLTSINCTKNNYKEFTNQRFWKDNHGAHV